MANEFEQVFGWQRETGTTLILGFQIPTALSPRPNMDPETPNNTVIDGFGQDPTLSFRPNDLGFGEWGMIWLSTWIGTSLAGGFFGAIVGLFAALFHNTMGFGIIAVLMGWLVGTIYSAVVGMLVVSSLAIVMWSIFWQRKPLILASVAGALTGGLSVGFTWVWWLSGPIGALGAGLYVLKHLHSPGGQLFKIWQDRNQRRPLQFNIVDIFKRTTAIAVLIAVSMFIIKWIMLYRFNF